MIGNSTHFDVIIIGGGSAGLSAALWCSDLGMSAIVLEQESEFGGQLLRTFNLIENYLGIDVTTGRELRDLFFRHVEKRPISRLTGVSIESIDLRGRTVTLADGRIFAGKAIIIATGVRRRMLGVPGEIEFAGQGVLDSGAKNRDEVRGKTVVIVGGGDAALENALILSDTAKEIIVVHRRREFSARTDFMEQAKERRVIRFILDSVVAEIIGNTAVEQLQLQDIASGGISNILADAVLIRIGVVPNTELFGDQLFLDDAGYVRADALCATNVAAIYAVGDVASPAAPTISNAVGQGSVAAKSVVDWLRSNSAKS